jgi:hypothetical protein
MDSQLIQRTRYQLQARVRATKTCPDVLYFATYGHLLEWIDTHPLLRALLAPLDATSTEYMTRISSLIELCVKREKNEEHENMADWRTRSREEAAALSRAVLRLVRNLDLEEHYDRYRAFVAAYVSAGAREQKPEHTVEALRDVCVTTLYDYLDESIDSRNAVLGLMIKYKHRCEMYRRSCLREAASGGLEGRVKERALAFDFYEYLYDQGVDFWIESVSASGEPDLISRDAVGERLVADAKYVDDSSKARRAVVSGFRQVLDYCRDHNEPVGYLVGFVSCDVVLDLKAERDDGFPCFRTGGYTVYYVIIDIHEHLETASKRPKPSTLELTHADLVSAIAENAAEAGS